MRLQHVHLERIKASLGVHPYERLHERNEREEDNNGTRENEPFHEQDE